MIRYRREIEGQPIGFWCFFVFFFGYLAPAALIAQIDKPNVSVSLYFTSEITACAPSGYPEAELQTQRSCRELTFNDIEEFVRQGLVEPVQRSIPPEQVSLGENLLGKIDAFLDVCTLSEPCTNSEDRYVLILTFEVESENDFNRKISISRIPQSDSPIPEYYNEGELSPRGRWINHQRADVFAPAYGVRWLLEIDNWTWDFGTEQ